MKKIAKIFLLLIVIAFFTTSLVSAKKVLPFLRKTTSGGTSTATGGVRTSVRFRPDRLGIIVNFSNLQSATRVDYFLSYVTRGVTQGVSGSITDTSVGAVERDIIFGSCSKGVCRYDSGISNAKFVITIFSASGKKIVRTYRLRV